MLFTDFLLCNTSLTGISDFGCFFAALSNFRRVRKFRFLWTFQKCLLGIFSCETPYVRTKNPEGISFESIVVLSILSLYMTFCWQSPDCGWFY